MVGPHFIKSHRIAQNAKISISSINNRIKAEKRTRAKIGRKYDKYPAQVQKATQNRRMDNRLFEIF